MNTLKRIYIEHKRKENFSLETAIKDVCRRCVCALSMKINECDSVNRMRNENKKRRKLADDYDIQRECTAAKRKWKRRPVFSFKQSIFGTDKKNLAH